jgi:hypothetical protein
MSNPNRSKVLIGFGAVAIVVIAAVAYWPPAFLSEDASGAIGVVQKHKATQISQKDVILGSEKTRQMQKVLYGDFFDAAKKVQTLSASFASREEAANIEKNVETLANEFRAEYANEMLAALNEFAMEAKEANQVELAHQAETLASEFKANAVELSAAEMKEFNDKFANIAAGSKEVNNFEVANKELGMALESRDEGQAASHIDNAEEALSNFDLANVSIENQQEYLAVMYGAVVALDNLELANFEMANRMENAQELANEADALANAGLANIQEQVSNSIELASELAELNSKEAGIKEQYSRLDSHELSNQIDLAEKAFGSMAGSNFQAELASMNDLAANREQFGQMVANQELADKLYSQLGSTVEIANTAEIMNKALGNQELANALGNEQQLSNEASMLASSEKN